MNKIILAGALLSLVYAGAANATLTPTISPTGAPLGLTYATLNSLPPGSAGGVTNTNLTVSFSGLNAAVVNGSSPNNYAAPVFSNGNGTAFGDADGVDTTNYIAVGASSSATISLPSATGFLGLLWGSVDSYNMLTFYSGANGTGTNVGVLTGANLPATGSNGNQTALGTVYVDVSSSLAFQSIVLTSTFNGFELDDIAFSASQVPEPVSLALLGTGLVGMGVFRRRAK